MDIDKKQVWKTIFGVERGALERVLNELADNDMQVYQLSRYTELLEELSDAPLTYYDVVAFNPALLAQKQSQALQATLAGILNANGQQQPLPFAQPVPCGAK